jgi:hypothetical protein
MLYSINGGQSADLARGVYIMRAKAAKSSIKEEAGDRIGSHVKKALIFWHGKMRIIKTPPTP